MPGLSAVALFIDDLPVLSSLRFSLAIEGFRIVEGGPDDALPAGLPVIDQDYREGGLQFLATLRSAGCGSHAIVLVTNPGRSLRTQAAALCAELIEKPLLGDELTTAILRMAASRKAA